MKESAAKAKKAAGRSPRPTLTIVSSQPSQTSHNLFWQSSLFNPVYLRNDVPVKHKELWETYAEPFNSFCAGFLHLCADLREADFNSWSEHNTIDRIIKPVLRLLGYSDRNSPGIEPWSEDEPLSVREGGELNVYKPDFMVVRKSSDLKYIEREKDGEKKLREARDYVILPIEAKYWGRIEEIENRKVAEDSKRADKKNQSDAARRFDINDQCLKYMEILNKDYGILTDGKTWRIYHRELSVDGDHKNFQFNLGHLIRHINADLDPAGKSDVPNEIFRNQASYDLFIDNAKYFYHIFSRQAVDPETGDRRFLDDLIEYSKTYVTEVEQELKNRFVNVMTYACNGFHRAIEANGESVDLETIRNAAESHLFNILFIKHCEDGAVLPMVQSEYRQISLTNIIAKLDLYNPKREGDGHNEAILKRKFSEDFEYNPNGHDLYERILTLTEVIQYGTKDKFNGFEIKGFKESVFSKIERKLIDHYKLTNSEMVRVLFELGYSESEVAGKRFQQIPYNVFSPRQLGSIYESFLEFRLEQSTTDMAFIKKQWVVAKLSSNKISTLDIPKVKKGELFFSPNNEERKVTGSYYTPDCVVQYIVRETLAPLVKGLSSSQISKLRVCDPALGSGHFLNAALNYLAKAYLEALENETNDDLTITLQDAKRTLLHTCLYGVDINPRAVKLAKMSLWLESANAGECLEDLSNQIKCADSLTNESLWKSEWKFLTEGIDAVIGNPPYLGEAKNKDIFREIHKSEFGKKYYHDKMDLFYFFMHLGIDILKPSGRLGYITTNYYTTAFAARNIRKAIFEETSIQLLVNLNELKVFGDAAGQHNLITLLLKTREKTETRIIDSSETGQCTSLVFESITSGQSSKTKCAIVDSKKLFDGAEHYIRISGALQGVLNRNHDRIIEKLKSNSETLGTLFNVNQGLHTGADKLSKRHMKRYSGSGKLGDGIFVLNKEEVKALGLNKSEKTLLKPLFKNSDIAQFNCVEDANLWFIDLSFPKDKNCDKSKIPNIMRHLGKFEKILRDRVDSSLSGAKKEGVWWVIGLRKQIDYDAPKIVVPYRARNNIFGYTEVPWYGVTDVYFITNRDTPSRISLKTALGILNSKLYFYWLYHMGKRKGDMLEMIQKPLSEIPIKIFSQADQRRLENISNKLISKPTIRWLEELNHIVYDLYGLTKAEVLEVEKLYEEKAQRTNVDFSECETQIAA